MCNEIAEGATLSAVCCQQHFPGQALLSRWMKEYDWIHDAFAHAYAMRGEVARDMVHDAATTEAQDKMELDNQKKVIDAGKWLAAQDAPRRFGQKKAELDVGGDLVINIISEIDRSKPVEREVIDVTEKHIPGIGEAGDNDGGDT